MGGSHGSPEPARAARELAAALGEYAAVSDRLRDELGRADFAETLASVERASAGLELSEADARQKRRIRRHLGPGAPRLLERSPTEGQRGFSCDYVRETILARPEADLKAAERNAHWLAERLGAGAESPEARDSIADALGEIRDFMSYLDPEASHQINTDEAFVYLAAATVEQGAAQKIGNGLLRLRRDQADAARRTCACWRRLVAALSDTGAEDVAWHPAVQVSAGPRAADARKLAATRGAARTGSEMEDMNMAQQADNGQGHEGGGDALDHCCQALADAISRLQEGAGSGGGVGLPAPSRDFGKALDQQVYASIGLPNLSSDTALGTSKEKLAEKLFLGLDRAIVRVDADGVTRFIFHPVRARALAPMETGAALGAQGVVAETVISLKPAILQAIHRLTPEVCICSEEEIDEIKRDIEATLEALVREARSSSGVFGMWALSLVGRLARDAVELIRMYGLWSKEPPEGFDELVKILRSGKVEPPNWLESCPDAPRDAGVGFLWREANVQAVGVIFAHLHMIARVVDELMGRDRGALLVRLRAQIETIPPAVADARAALARAGVSDTDLKATFAAPTDEAGNAPTDTAPDGDEIMKSIEVHRLFDWIESAANGWRAELLEDSLNERDIRWIRDTLRVQIEGVSGISLEQGPSKPNGFPINVNRYGLGRRQIAELRHRLCEARKLAERLCPSNGTERQAAAR